MILMTIKYACFISYPHPRTEGRLDQRQHDLITDFIGSFLNGLKFYLKAYLRKDIYFDEDYLEGGSIVDKDLAQAICESVCMIVVFVPAYSDSNYCKREFLTMERIEKKRGRLLKDNYYKTHRMIIPIILRGDAEELPHKITTIKYFNEFSNFHTATQNMWENEIYRQILEVIARDIRKFHTFLTELEDQGNTIDCPKLASEQEASRAFTKTPRKKIKQFPFDTLTNVPK